MSREEFADAINAAISDLFPGRRNLRHLYVNSRWVGAMERGERRWTGEERRAALRAVTGASSDAELGLHPQRDRLGDELSDGRVQFPNSVKAVELASVLPTANTAAAVYPSVDVVAGRDSEDTAAAAGSVMLVSTEPDTDLVELASVLEEPGIGVAELTAAELACERLDRGFAAVRPDDALDRSHLLTRYVLNQLRRPQTLGHHERLVALAARLAGLRAWASFDLDDHRKAEHWYQVAVSAAGEARAGGLGAWLLGAQSLIPWHRRDFTRTLELIDRGLYLAGHGSDATTIAWLYTLKARACAGLRDRDGFETAYAQAQEAAEFSSERDRRHGMDFDQGALDLRYYGGMSWLLLHRPVEARLELTSSLSALPESHIKARSVLMLGLADAAVQSDDVDQAVDLTRTALTNAARQSIMPILQQGRRIRRLVHQRQPEAAEVLDEPLREFALALTSASGSSGS